jgi:hypothetical protein
MHPINWAPSPTNEVKPPGHMVNTINHHQHQIKMQNYKENLQEDQNSGKPPVRVRDLAPLDPHKKM